MHTARSSTSPSRGSTLLLVIVLMAVLTVIGMAAVSLSSQERGNASAKGRRDAIVACATAAQAEIWAEIIKYGPRYFSGDLPVVHVTLPDGTDLAIAHYGQDPDGTLLVNKVVTPVACASDATTTAEDQVFDLTNRDGRLPLTGHCYRIVARCTDRAGRQLEVEVVTNTVF